MAKKAIGQIKLQIEGGAATPAPPVGPALGQYGVNIGEFIKAFNAKTEKMKGDIIPVVITVYQDRSFSFELRQPPVAFLIKKAVGVEKGSGEPNRVKVASITRQQVREIAERKLADMNATSIEGAIRMVEGTAKSMGIEIKE